MRVDRRRSGAKRIVWLAGVVLTALALVPIWEPAEAQVASQVGATVDETGWWNRANAVPASPIPVVTLPVVTAPPPPSVPAGAIAVSVTAGEIDKVSAIGLSPELSSGTVEQAVLHIAEATSGEQIENESATLVACPITDFWVGGSNGEWKNVPRFDCLSSKAAGTRTEQGEWVFDITAIASRWLTPGDLSPNGVAIVPDVQGAGDTFQVVLAGDPDFVGIEFDASESSRPTTTTATVPATSGGGSPALPATSPPTTTATPTTVATAPAGDAQPTRVSTASKILGNFPGGTLLLVPLVLVVGGLLMLTYGPLGEPASGVARDGGVSRALAARERATTNAQPVTRGLEAT